MTTYHKNHLVVWSEELCDSFIIVTVITFIMHHLKKKLINGAFVKHCVDYNAEPNKQSTQLWNELLTQLWNELLYLLSVPIRAICKFYNYNLSCSTTTITTAPKFHLLAHCHNITRFYYIFNAKMAFIPISFWYSSKFIIATGNPVMTKSYFISSHHSTKSSFLLPSSTCCLFPTVIFMCVKGKEYNC